MQLTWVTVFAHEREIGVDTEWVSGTDKVTFIRLNGDGMVVVARHLKGTSTMPLEQFRREYRRVTNA
jgi:hypothetical protein